MKLIYSSFLLLSCLILFSCGSESFEPVKYELSFPEIEVLEFADFETLSGVEYFLQDQWSDVLKTKVKTSMVDFEFPFDIRPTMIVLDSENSGTVTYLKGGTETNSKFSYESTEDIIELNIEQTTFSFDRNDVDGSAICQYSYWEQKDRTQAVYDFKLLNDCNSETHKEQIENINTLVNSFNGPILGTAQISYRIN